MTLFVAPVVEGETEELALGALLRRVWKEALGCLEEPRILEPFRGKRSQLGHTNGAVLATTVEKAYLKLCQATKHATDATALLLILLDADKDCPATLAPRLLRTAYTAVPSNAHVACVLPNRTFEDWIVAGASTLGGVCGLPPTLQVPEESENGKGENWLIRQIRSQDRTTTYKKTDHALDLVRKMNLADCQQKSRSFRKLVSELEKRFPPPPPPEEPPPAEPEAPAAPSE